MNKELEEWLDEAEEIFTVMGRNPRKNSKSLWRMAEILLDTDSQLMLDFANVRWTDYTKERMTDLWLKENSKLGKALK